MGANTILTSIVTGGSNNHTTTSEEANSLATDFVTAGVVGTIGLNAGSGGTGSFCVNADSSPDMGVTVKAGQAYLAGTPSGQNSQMLRARASSDYTTYVINSNSSGATKYDWIYLSVSAANANTPSASADNVVSIVTSRSSSNVTDNGTPPTYGLVLAVVTVANGASSITNSNIQDKRVAAAVTIPAVTTSGWTALSNLPATVTANGNRSYSLVFSSVDITGTVSPGMKLRTTRTTPAPTQCTSLNGTTQYYSKSSPAGMTFTDDFVVSAWVKLSAYNAAANQYIASRYNGTSGWGLYLSGPGQVNLVGFNAGAANFSQITSYQSIPVGKWVHISAQLDMSTFTATTTTSYVMLDGVDVPSNVNRGGTNPTALIQAGNLEIGSTNGGATPFNGKIAQVAIYSAKVTQANVLATISLGLAGTETSLISAYSFNNSINDLNANANNLTANGSAVATNADSSFGGQADGTISSTLDYGIITKTAFSTNTTLTVQVPEGCTIPTSGGVSAVSYATGGIPYGFPKQKGKWTISSFVTAVASQAAAVNSTWYNVGSHQLNIPIGEWQAIYQNSPWISNTSGSIFQATLSTANNSESNKEFTTEQYLGATTTGLATPRYRSRPISLSSSTVHYLNLMNKSGTSTTLQNIGDSGSALIEAELAYL